MAAGTWLLVVASCYILCSSMARAGTKTEALEEFLDKEIQKFKVDFHRTLEAERIRRKRDTGLMLGMTASQEPRSERIRVAPSEGDPFFPSNYRVNCWTWVHPDTALPSALLSLITEDGQFLLINFDGQVFHVVLQLAVPDRAYKAKAFVSGPYVWFAVVFEDRQNGRHYIQMYRFDGVGIHLKQTIPLAGTADMDIVYNRGDWYMAVATFQQLGLYEWRQTQFDAVAWASVSGLRAVTLWSSAGAVHIATAVSNGKDGSPVFLYTRRNGKFSKLQLIAVPHASRVIWFKVDGNDYLLFVCDHAVVIYWWAGNQFLEFQTIADTAGALDAAALHLPNGEAAIALSFQNEIRFYLEGHSSEYYMSYSGFSAVSLSTGFGFFYQANMYYFLFLTFDLASLDAATSALGPAVPSNLWRLNLTNYHAQQEDGNPLSSCIGHLNDRLEDNNLVMEYVESNLNRVWVTNKEQTIETPIYITGPVDVKEGLTIAKLILQGSEPSVPIPQVTSVNLHNDMLQQKHNVGDIEGNMPGLIYKSQDQVINGDLIFLTPFSAGNVQLPSLRNDLVLNGIPLPSLAENTLKIQGNQILWHPLEASSLGSRSLILDGTINNIQTQDAFLLHQSEVVTSELHFQDIKVHDITLVDTGTINGLKSTEFVVVDRPQVINGLKTFHNLVVQKDIIVHGQTNQIDLSVFIENVLRLDSPELPDLSQLEFSSPLTVDGDIYVDGLINGIVDLKDLSTRALDLVTDQLVTGKKSISQPVFVNGDVSVDGNTNGVDVSGQILTLSTDQFIPGTVMFDSFEVMNNLSTGTVNGYDLRREVVTLQGPPQVITGRKTFTKPVQVLLDVELSNASTVNGLDLSGMVEASSRAENVVFFGASTFQSLLIQEVVVSDSINGISIDHLYRNLWRKSTDQVILPPVHFLQPITIEHDLQVTAGVNSYDLTEDFVHINGNEEILGNIRFTDTVYVHGALQMSPGMTINGFDISEYNRSVVPAQRDSVIHGHVVFSSLEVRGNLIINGGIGGFNIDNLMRTNQHQTITGHVRLLSDRTTITGNLAVDGLYLHRDINGVDLSEFNKHVVYDFDLDSDGMAVLGNKDFVGGLTAERIVSRGTLDGVDLEKWLTDSVKLSTDGDIAGFKNLSEAEFLGGLEAETLNGVPLSQYLADLVLTSDTHIRGKKTIAGFTTVEGDLNIKGFLNGVNLDNLKMEAAYKDADNIFTEPVSIDGNVEIESLKTGETSLLDGVPWNHLIFLDQNQALLGVNTFLDRVVAGQATVRRLINGCNITKLAEEAIYLGQPFPDTGNPLTVRSLIIHGDLDVAGQLGGINLQLLAQNMLLKTGEQTLTGPVLFTRLEAANAQLKVVNQMNLPEIMNDAVLHSQPQTISGVKHFTHNGGVTFTNDLVILGNVEVDTTVNGVDLSALEELAVLKAMPQEIRGHKTFLEVEVQGDIYIRGLLNGVSVPSDIILLETDEEIVSPLVLQQMSRLEGNLYVIQKVDGVVLDQFIQNRVTLLHHQDIQAHIEFHDTLQTESLDILGAVNDVPIEDIVLKRSGATVSGQKVFENSITIQGDLRVQELNNVDLQEFSTQLVRINQPQQILDVVEFVTVLEVQNDLLIEESINNVQLQRLEQDFADYHQSLSTEMQSLRDQMNALASLIHRSQEELLQKQFEELLFFQLFQTLDLQLHKIFSNPLPKSYSSKDLIPSLSEQLLGWSPSCDTGACCSDITTELFDLDHEGRATLSKSVHGRLFPFIPETPTEDNNLYGFALLTNSTFSEPQCRYHNPEMWTTVPLQEMEVPDITRHTQSLITPGVGDVKMFTDADTLYLLITYTHNKIANASQSSLFQYDQYTNSWSQHQFLGGLQVTTSMDFIIFIDERGFRHLLVAMTDHWNLHVYRWTDRKQFDLVTHLPIPDVTATLWVKTGSSLRLLVSTPHSQLLSVYTYTPDSSHSLNIEWFQGVELSGITILHGFQIADEVYVAASSESLQKLLILQWRGHEGFVPFQYLPISEITDVTSFRSLGGDLFLVVTTECEVKILKAITIGVGYH